MPDEWLTYAQAGQRLGISTAAARQLSRRRDWQRRTPNAYGIPATVLVPSEVLGNARKVEAVPHPSGIRTASVEANANGLQTAYELAVTALTLQLDRANHRIDGLESQLADAQAAAERISTDSDPLTVIGIQTLSQAVEMLREDLAIANSSLLSERERVEHAERKLETERQDARRRIDGLYADLADARTAAMITGCEAAALRSRIEILTDRQRWWQRWFR
jgi:chromosome segregation ATPase